ncbi:MAG: 16S rRNA (uracil(1498)-N(3))-methyltransferase [Clostridia bacterium]|nr:16S rRNA (uracil(1498)-N(3))-methyltransferase [Clostridia bacterium]
MHRFFLETAPQPGAEVPLTPEDAHHACQVLRMQPGETAELLSGGARFLAEAVSIGPKEAVFRVLEPLPSTEPALRVTLFQGLPKADKMDWIVQKAVELGAAAVVPVAMERCVVKLDRKDAARRQERWQRIAREACKQSGRCEEPAVGLPLTLGALCAELRSFEAAVVPWEEAQGLSLPRFRAEHPEVRRLAVVIGPEGGIAPREIDVLREAGALPVTLGPRILRTETAGLASLAALMALWGEMEA